MDDSAPKHTKCVHSTIIVDLVLDFFDPLFKPVHENTMVYGVKKSNRTKMDHGYITIHLLYYP